MLSKQITIFERSIFSLPWMKKDKFRFIMADSKIKVNLSARNQDET